MPLVPSYIKKLQNYKPGKPISEATRETGISNIIKLASNENPLGPSIKSIDAALKVLKNSHRYPDASGLKLREKLAKKLTKNTFADFVMFQNSGTEATEAAIKIARRYFYSKGKPQKNRNLCVRFKYYTSANSSVYALSENVSVFPST